jgi:hypothetical protein
MPNKKQLSMSVKMYKQFKTYYIRCRVCGDGKPRESYEGAWHVCKECKKTAKANNKSTKKTSNKKTSKH